MSERPEPSDAALAEVGRALGRIPSGLFVLTAGRESVAEAMLVSWVQQSGFSPPTITVAIANDRPMLQILRQEKSFALSILGKSDSALLRALRPRRHGGEPPFRGLPTGTTPAGQTILLSALAWLECRVINHFDTAGDHCLILAQVTAGRVLKHEPAFTHLRGNGLHY